MQAIRSRLAFALFAAVAFIACSDALITAPRATLPRPDTAIPVADVSSDPSPVIIAAGDIADCNSTGDEATARLLDSLQFDAVLVMGDLAYEDGKASEFTNCYNPTWGRHKAKTKPAPGNHEYHTSGASGYFNYFGPAAKPAGESYYSFNLGAWHILSLNSNVSASAGSDQLNWVRQDLAANPSACALAFWHHPVTSSGEHGNISKMAEMWRVLDSAGVDVVLAGHDHDYERFAPQTARGGAIATGIREFVVGTGGRKLRPFSTVRANSEVRSNSSWGVLKMTLNATSYSWEFVPVAAGTFADQGTADCVQIGPPEPNQQPVATLTTPAEGATFTAPATISLEATASDPDGNLNRVDFYRFSTLIGSDATPPYTVTWRNAQPGTYTITARAVDAAEAWTESNNVQITVNAPSNSEPTVELISPVDDVEFTSPATITLEATASDVDGNLTRVEFFQGTTLIGSATASPYTFTWTNVPPGSYTLTARAVDAADAASTSTEVKVTVNAPPPPNSAPTVSLTAPSDRATFTAPATISLTATASDPDAGDAIARVEFLNGTSLLGSVSASPYSFTWSNVEPGNYTLTARAVDGSGAIGTSAAAQITVNPSSPTNQPPLANPGGPYTGTEGVVLSVNGAASTDPENGQLTYAWDFGDGSTATGASPSKTYGDNGAYTITLVVTDPVGATHSATTTVTIANALPTLTFTWPSTVESGREYTLTITEATDVPADQTGLEYRFECAGAGGYTPWSSARWVTCPGLAGPDSGMVRAVVRDKDGGWRQKSRNIEITAGPPPNSAPTVSLTAPLNGAEFTAPAAITLEAAAADADGNLSRVEFYRGTTLLGAATASPYRFSWTNVAAGQYTLTARAVDAVGATTTSTEARVTVNAPQPTNQPPVARPGGPYAGTEGVSLTLSGGGSTDPENGALTYAWTFGDGTSGVGASPAKTYADNGSYTVTLVVTDPVGATHSATTTVTIANVAPGGTFMVPPTVASGSAYTLAIASASDVAADLPGLEYQFDCGTGLSVWGSASSVSCPGVAGPLTRAVSGAVRDKDGGVRPFTANVSILAPPNTAPVANAGGPYTGTEGVALTLNGAGSSDPNGDALTYAWTFGDGTSGTGVSPSKTYTDNGTFTITLVVSDPSGASHSVTTTATIANVAPTGTLTAPSAPVASGAAYTLAISNAADVAADQTGLQYQFDCGGGYSPWSSASSLSCAGVAGPATRAVRGAVRDKDGGVRELPGTVEILAPPNSAPTVSLSAPSDNASFNAPATITLTATAADADGNLSRVDFYNGETLLGGDATAPYSFTWSNVAAGSYVLTARAVDAAGAAGTSGQVRVTVTANQPPVASAGGPYAGTEGVALTLNGSGSSDPENGALTYAWDLGDGTTATGASPSKTYGDNGTYTITLVVSDPAGATHSATATVTISNAPPSGTFMVPSTAASGAVFDLTINGATDVAADVGGLQYQFDCGTGFGAWGAAASVTCPGVPGPATRAVRAAVRDKDGGVRSFSGSVSIVAPPNTAPTISLIGPPDGATFTAPASIRLTAIPEDVDGNLSRVEFYEGTTLLGSATAVPYTFEWGNVSAGTYTLTARAADAAGAATRSSQVHVTVNAPPAPNQPPLARPGGPYTGTEGVALTFDGGTSSDPENGQLTYAWSFGDGTTATGRSVSKTYADNGAYTITLVVADPAGTSHSATTTATITNAAPSATLSAAPASVNQGSAFTLALDGASDAAADVASLQFAFDCGDGTGLRPYGAASAISCPTVAGGTRTVRAAVRDKDGASAEYSGSVPVANVAPSVTVVNAPTSVSRNTTFRIDFRFSDPGTQDGPWSYTINWGDGESTGPTSVATQGGLISVTHRKRISGTVTITIGVTDKVGATGQVIWRLNVSNDPPVANAGGPYSAAEGVAFSLNGGGSRDPDNDALTYTWSFGDGTTATGASPSKTYADNGTYTITLVVSDPDGETSTATATATIANAAPTGSFSAPATVASGSSYNVAITGATDVTADRPGLEYQFDCGTGLGAWSSTSSATCSAVTGPATRAVRGAMRDKDGGVREFSGTVNILAPPNSAPTVSLTAPFDNATFTAPATITVAATAADVDGNLSRVDFYQGTTLLGSAASAPFTFTWASVPTGSYILTARAVDAGGAATTSAGVRVNVNARPVANAGGPYTKAEGVALTLDGGASTDPNNDPLTYAWDFGDGTTAAGRTPSKVYADNGTYTITLVVSDPSGASHSATTTATITNVAPTGTFMVPATVESGAAYTLAIANGSDVAADRSTLQYRFDCGSGYGAWGSASSASCAGGLGPATRAVHGAIRDKDGGVREFPGTVEILNMPPTVSLTAPADGASFTAPATITLSATAADVDGNLSRVEFYHGSTLLGAVSTAPFTFPWSNVGLGSYTLTARAVDAGGLATTSSPVRITISNLAPVAHAGGPYTGSEGVSLTVDGSGSTDGNGDALTYAWSFGDGTTATGRSPSKVYGDNGTYTITLVVSDPAGATHTATATATIANVAPTLTFSAPATVRSGEQYTLSITNATDVPADQPGLQYQFNCGGGFGAWATATSVTCPGVAGPATLTVRAAVRDKDGGTRQQSRNIEVLNSAPMVSLTAPLDGLTLNAPATITVEATASDIDGNLTRVEFLNGTAVLGSDDAAPYSFTWSNVPAGTYMVTARAVDAAGATTASAAARVTVVNTPPVAHSGGPYSGNEGVALTLDGSGSADANGDVLTYAWNFGDGATSTSRSPSKTYADNGTYTVTLVVADPSGASHTVTTTATIANVAPTGTFMVPSAVPSGAAYTLTIASANDVAADRASLEFQFDCGSGFAAWGLASSRSCAGGSGPATRAVRGAVRDKDGGVREFTGSVEILNAAPSVSLTAPSDGARFTAPASITLSASAADVDGNLSRVEFYRGTTLLGSDDAEPYTFTWTNVAAASYTVTARAVDAAGAATTSAAVQLTVNAPPIANPGALYAGTEGIPLTVDGGASSDLEGGALTYAWNFGDGTTATGRTASKVYGDNGTFTITLVVTDPAGASHSATTTATIANAAPTGTFSVPATVNGGAGYTLAITNAADVAADQPTIEYRFDCGAGFGAWGSASSATCAAVAGPVTRAVRAEVRDKDGGVREFSANVQILNVAPTVSLTEPTDGASFNAPATISLSATAADIDGNLARVEFYRGTTLLASDDTAPYSFTWSNVAAGSYTVTARAIDAAGAATTSAPIHLTVSNQAPVANAGGPYTGTEGVALTLSASASSDPNGDALSYAWDFGDGTTATGVSPTKAYGDNGTYAITLTVSDPLGASHSVSTTATIANVAPTLTFVWPTTPVASGATFTLSVTNAADAPADQPTLEYRFDCGPTGYTPWSPASSVTCPGVTGPAIVMVRGAVRDKDGDPRQISREIEILPPPAYFLVIDQSSISEGSSPNNFSSSQINRDLSNYHTRTELRYFAANPGRTITLYAGSVGSEGFHAIKTVPTSWNSAGPTTDGLRNYLLAGPGLGTPDVNGNRQTLLSSVLDVTPLRATGLRLLIGQPVCALVRDGNVSTSYSPLRANLTGRYLGIVAFVVNSVTPRTSSSTALPAIGLTITDADAVCAGVLQRLMTAPAPTSSSSPNDTGR